MWLGEVVGEMVIDCGQVVGIETEQGVGDGDQALGVEVEQVVLQGTEAG